MDEAGNIKNQYNVRHFLLFFPSEHTLYLLWLMLYQSFMLSGEESETDRQTGRQ